jgi:hypothetical protein
MFLSGAADLETLFNRPEISTPPAKFIHQLQYAGADCKQFLPGGHHQFVRQQFLLSLPQRFKARATRCL